MIRGDDRKYQFKKQSDLENGRRRREETSTQIRKAKREEKLMKRRQAPQPIPTSNMDGGEEKFHYTKEDIPQLMGVFTQGTSTDDELLKALIAFRRMLSVETNPPVDEVLAAGALPYFARFLGQNDKPTVVFEAAWTLTNIASTDKTLAVVNENGVTQQLVRLLLHEKAHIREQAAWCLGNIAGDSSDLRDMVLREGALNGLLMNLQNPESMSLLSNTAWAISNLCRGKPSPPSNLIQPAIGPLATLLNRDVTDEVLVDALWALSYLADGENDRIEAILTAVPEITQTLVGRLGQSSLDLLTPLVRTLGNFVTGTDAQTQAVVNAGVIDYMLGLLEHSNKNLRKEACWLLSNIAAGSKGQLEAVLKKSDVMERIIDIARSDRWEVKKEALWVVSNIITTGDEYHVRQMVQREGFAVLTEALESIKDSKMLLVALEAIEVVLKVGDQLNLNYTILFDEYNGISHVEELQNHENETVYEKAVDLLETYFGIEDEEDENIAPTQEGGLFAFGMNPAKELFPAEGDKYEPFGQSNSLFDFSSMEH